MVTHIYTRYFILIHPDYNYLKKCLQEIKEYLMTINLKLNQKTAIYSFYNGFTFLGYRFLTKRNRQLEMEVDILKQAALIMGRKSM